MSILCLRLSDGIHFTQSKCQNAHSGLSILFDPLNPHPTLLSPISAAIDHLTFFLLILLQQH